MTMVDLYAKYTPLSKILHARNLNPKTKMTDQQERQIDMLTEEMAVLSRDLGIDLVLMAIIPIDA
jgi:hypothetical protein